MVGVNRQQLGQIGELVREVTDRQMESSRAQTQARRMFLSGPDPAGARSRSAVRAWTLASAACAALVAAIVLWSWGRASPTTFSVGDPAVVGRVGEWLAAGEQPVAMQFSDGSALELEPGTKLRVTATTVAGADVLIESGTLHASIRHRSDATRWAVHAGPFVVRVTGTRFDTSWDPAGETLRVAVEEGGVAVSGPQLPPERTVVAGEYLVVAVRAGKMALGKGKGLEALASAEPVEACDAGAGAPEPERVAAQPEPASEGRGGADTSAPSEGRGGGTAAEVGTGGRGAAADWRELARTRKYRDAWTAIETTGFEQTIGPASAAELMAIADVARFAGQPRRAKQALMRLREHHGATGQSAFLLGRLAADQLGAPGEAVRWFETYLAEEPNGPLAEQALGRILDLQRGGKPERARAVAERYLSRYPNGAYAALARSILER